MSKIDNGGAAFPTLETETFHPQFGMSLRDYFAGQALTSGHARTSLPDYDLRAMFAERGGGITREQILAAESYRIADAMLAERAKEGAP